MSDYRIEIRKWEEARYVAGPVRYAIFIQDKDPISGIELDDMDAQCMHAIASEPGGATVGTSRLFPDGRIGRLAVPKPWWRRGVGAALIQALIEEARKRSFPAVIVKASLQAAEFYRDFGFVAEGKVLRDGTRLEQQMRMALR